MVFMAKPRRISTIVSQWACCSIFSRFHLHWGSIKVWNSIQGIWRYSIGVIWLWSAGVQIETPSGGSGLGAAKNSYALAMFIFVSRHSHLAYRSAWVLCNSEDCIAKSLSWPFYVKQAGCWYKSHYPCFQACASPIVAQRKSISLYLNSSQRPTASASVCIGLC